MMVKYAPLLGLGPGFVALPVVHFQFWEKAAAGSATATQPLWRVFSHLSLVVVCFAEPRPVSVGPHSYCLPLVVPGVACGGGGGEPVWAQSVASGAPGPLRGVRCPPAAAAPSPPPRPPQPLVADSGSKSTPLGTDAPTAGAGRRGEAQAPAPHRAPFAWRGLARGKSGGTGGQ